MRVNNPKWRCNRIWWHCSSGNRICGPTLSRCFNQVINDNRTTPDMHNNTKKLSPAEYSSYVTIPYYENVWKYSYKKNIALSSWLAGAQLVCSTTTSSASLMKLVNTWKKPGWSGATHLRYFMMDVCTNTSYVYCWKIVREAFSMVWSCNPLKVTRYLKLSWTLRPLDCTRIKLTN